MIAFGKRELDNRKIKLPLSVGEAGWNRGETNRPCSMLHAVGIFLSGLCALRGETIMDKQTK
jgi:hypothetical protein